MATYWERQEEEFLAKLDETLDRTRDEAQNSSADHSRGKMASSSTVGQLPAPGISASNSVSSGQSTAASSSDPESSILKEAETVLANTGTATPAVTGAAPTSTTDISPSINAGDKMKILLDSKNLSSAKMISGSSSSTASRGSKVFQKFIDRLQRVIEKKQPGFSLSKFLDGTVMNQDSFAFLVEEIFAIDPASEFGHTSQELFEQALEAQGVKDSKLDLVQLLQDFED
ncbi:unnamed protein product [Amoebophrya sp. A120]|nr:unnamed protein product [Amoebophrya sp. A120]|eukprot:GSA120T00018863001.1